MLYSNSPSRHWRSECRGNHIARHGSSLLEVLSALVITSIVLVPSSTIIIDSINWSNRIESHAELRLLSKSLHADQAFLITRDFVEGSSQGDFRTMNRREFRFQSTWSLITTGLPSPLMQLTSTCWSDENGNQQLDTNEPRLVATSLISDVNP